MLKIELVVPEYRANAVVSAICKAAITRTGGNGKVFVSPVEDAVRIRTGEHGEPAI
jgi:nitrogen regulatory protein P-II 1